jgi:hypothetical protein
VHKVQMIRQTGTVEQYIHNSNHAPQSTLLAPDGAITLFFLGLRPALHETVQHLAAARMAKLQNNSTSIGTLLNRFKRGPTRSSRNAGSATQRMTDISDSCIQLQYLRDSTRSSLPKVLRMCLTRRPTRHSKTRIRLGRTTHGLATTKRRQIPVR